MWGTLRLNFEDGASEMLGIRCHIGILRLIALIRLLSFGVMCFSELSSIQKTWLTSPKMTFVVMKLYELKIE